jgi:hypothetical protein
MWSAPATSRDKGHSRDIFDFDARNRIGPGTGLARVTPCRVDRRVDLAQAGRGGFDLTKELRK